MKIVVIPSAAQAGGGGRSKVEEPVTFAFAVEEATPQQRKAKLEVPRLEDSLGMTALAAHLMDRAR